MRNTLSFLDKCIVTFDRGVRLWKKVPMPVESNPAEGVSDELHEPEVQKTIQLMRINHAGEMAAQGLYYGHALCCSDESLTRALYQAANEEYAHLSWCQFAIHQLGGRESRLSALWFWGSVAMGATAALYDRNFALGFIVETENQVESHLNEHLKQLPENARASRAIVSQMQADEQAHANWAKNEGGIDMPEPVRKLMHAMAGFMKRLAPYL